MVDINIKKCERFIDTVSDFTLQLTFKKIPLTEFFLVGGGIKEEYIQLAETAIKRSLPFPHYISVRSSFIHVPQPKPHILTVLIQKQM